MGNYPQFLEGKNLYLYVFPYFKTHVYPRTFFSGGWVGGIFQKINKIIVRQSRASATRKGSTIGRKKIQRDILPLVGYFFRAVFFIFP